MKEFPRKFLSLREKNGIHRRSKSVPPGHKDKSRPSSAEVFRALFKKDGSKNTSKTDDEPSEPDQAKIEKVQRLLEERQITNVAVDYIRDVLMTDIAEGDPDKTADFIHIEQDAASGVIVPYDPSVHILGAENRDNVTCYLDALLFAMFAKLDAFECMLRTEFPSDDARARLVTLLRLWVNLLRSGRFIRTDLTKLMQDTMSDCGWPDAKLLEQQDTSEAFAFLTETLQLPLLSLQVDLFHHGKKDKDDHKVVYERLLNLAVPPDPENKGVKLEDCLEEYFNARVDVLRDHEESRKGTFEDQPAGDGSLQKATRTFRPDEGGMSTLSASPVEIAPLRQHFASGLVRSASQASGSRGIDRVGSPATITPEKKGGVEEDGSTQRPAIRARSTSVIQRVVVDKHGRPTGTEEGAVAKRTRRKGSTIVKAVTIPAWQFFRLIPWHALTPNEPRSDSEVALNFDQRPVVGICLKRYAMTESGQPQRYNTFIDIPDSLRLPHFMLAEGPVFEEFNGLSTEYKLVLQSVVCHRGDSLQSGHYIAFARVAPKLLTGNRRHNFDPPPDYEEAQWVKFDDLDLKNRVAYVDDIKQALRVEMPYLLFYQIVPMFDMLRISVDETRTEPPSYNESRTSFELGHNDLSSSAHGALGGNHRDELLELRSKPPSIRLSAEMDRSARNSLWTTSHTGSTPMGSRRQSLANTESSPATPGAVSPVLSPVDETTTSRLSRAASRFTLGRQSRPPSQSGETRISFSMARLGGLMKSSREPLVAENGASPAPLSVSTGPASDPAAKTPDSPVDVTPQIKEKHKHRGSKVKADKHNKSEQDEPPERECSVM